MKQAAILQLLRRTLNPALGCTEPVAVSLAGARARQLLGENPDSVEYLLSGNVFKNGMGVVIPGTENIGLKTAASLGILYGNPTKGLQVFEGISHTQVKCALEWKEKQGIALSIKKDTPPLYVECRLASGNHKAVVIIAKSHDHIVYENLDGEELKNANTENSFYDCKDNLLIRGICFEDLYDFSNNIDLDNIRFLEEMAEVNMEISREGLKNEYGLQLGRQLLASAKTDCPSMDMLHEAMAYTAAASDARMDGCELPVITNSGSGNQGLAISIPVSLAQNHYKADDERFLRALCLANLTAVYLKQYLGKLSAYCGVTHASTGAAVGITYIAGGDYTQVCHTIRNMAGSISGMVCDGAKIGCSLKISAAMNAAVTASLLALKNISVSPTDGLVSEDMEETIRWMGELGSEGMKETDTFIIEKMHNKATLC